jgi:SAM-dependent methyltransferase
LLITSHSDAEPQSYQSANLKKWEFDNSLYQKHLKLYLDHMYRYLKLSGAVKVLDVGCGEGVVYRAMRERGWVGEWTGLDYSTEAIEYAQKNSPEAQWQAGSAYELPFSSDQFDLVFCSEVLEHLPSPQLVLDECARVAGDWLLISVPREPLFRTLTWISTTLRIGGDPGHVNYWSAAGFRKFVSHAGQLHTWDWTTIYQIALVELQKVARPQHG